jgi:hypothetical protein
MNAAYLHWIKCVAKKIPSILFLGKLSGEKLYVYLNGTSRRGKKCLHKFRENQNGNDNMGDLGRCGSMILK